MAVTPWAEVEIVELVGEIDLATGSELERRLENGISERRVVVVDLSDCTFVDVQVLRVLRAGYRSTRHAHSPFFVVLPFSAAAEVRFAMLRLAADIAPYPVVPDRAAVLLSLARESRARVAEACASERLRDLRARIWENGHRRERLLVDRNVLLLAQREALRRSAGRRRGAG